MLINRFLKKSFPFSDLNFVFLEEESLEPGQTAVADKVVATDPDVLHGADEGGHVLQGGEVGKQTRGAAAEVKGIAGGRAEFDLISHNIFFGDIIPLQTLIEQLKHLRQREAQWSKDEAVAVVGRDKGSVTEFLNLRRDKGSVKEFFNLTLCCQLLSIIFGQKSPQMG